MEQETDRLLDAVRPSDWVMMLVRLKDEHLKLRQTIAELEAAVNRADRMPDVLTVAHEIRRIKQPLIAYMNELERHSAWEEEELRPLIDQYFYNKHVPMIKDSIWVMEKDHELGTAYLEAFLQMLDDFGIRPHAGMVAGAVGCFLQGCRLLKEHFRMEEHIVLPLVEQMLSDSNAG
ncbi:MULTISPECIES: hemerythrin domain-containing protein [unclassified Paenibacillus]|uniref:hemerythrin domain-containing protein n=1 Tax=unclassified Paenibacillus TaxID=185978 RepID=UPI001AE30902|nr:MULTISPECIES: hemerythrin domain-containing protein [unclassified Paenibacillus]MBP1153719.1 hemerythrin-like domain-containing protein [Paenibacillus sp. PvP091]MBP1170896.1 hemerythrin-like domain-containing protein [Paenibacillus sp. PvR098]MBP2441924.1 hemerythrin-like domain-containing protein [Paenibacillus sp. PvP052]